MATFNASCKNCHAQGKDCTEKQSVRNAKNNNCSSCHMVKNESIDIPHVAVTDHFIRRKPKIENEESIRKFIGLKSYNNPNPSNRIKARAFLEFFERYQPNPLLLDTALAYLAKADKRDLDADKIRSYFLKEDYQKVKELSEKSKRQEIKDAWTAYRIGESLAKLNQLEEAVKFHTQAVELMPLGLDFRMKLANALLGLKQNEKAKKEVEFILNENRKYDEAHKALGFIQLGLQDFKASANSSAMAIALNPDNEQAYINLAVAHYNLQNIAEVKKVLLKAKRLYPNNHQISAMLKDLN